MQELRISQTKTSPEVALYPNGILKIKGRSIHENIVDFYKPVVDWINEYIKVPADVTVVDINLEYFNSASTKLLVHVLQRISHVQLSHKKFIINWYYDDGDDDILERGEYFSSVLKIPFNLIKVT